MIKLDRNGLIPAIVQDDSTNKVLMMAYMSPESLKLTIEKDEVWFYSRSRDMLWHKGETSGNFLKLKNILLDCDGDTLLLKVDPTGPACHTGAESCFFVEFDAEDKYDIVDSGSEILEDLYSIIEQRKMDRPSGSYTTSLFDQGIGRISQKVIEEAGESALAGATGDKKNLPNEITDMLYHTLVLMVASDVSLSEVWKELEDRKK